MKILMMSKTGDSLGVAQKLKEEGNDVKVFVEDRKYRWASQGIVDRITSWRPVAGDWADLVVADMVGFGNRRQILDRFGVPHVGFNELGEMIELDRIKQVEVFEAVGIRMPETHTFDSPQNALDLLDSWRGKGYVIKPSGNIETAKTFVCETQDVYRWALEQYSAVQELIVQRIVEGVEVSTEGWFNGSDWIRPFNHTFEEKRFMDSDVGPMTGCMGNVVMIAPDRHNQLVNNLRKLAPFLRRIEYRGPVDLNTIVNKDGIFALELTMRFGYDAIEALYELMNEPLGATLAALATGAKKTLSVAKGSVGLAVRVSVPPYPHSDPSADDRGLPIMSVDGANGLNHLFLTDVYKDGDMYRWAASDGVLMKVTGKAHTVQNARASVYGLIKKLQIMNAQYRKDIGLRFESDMEMLEKWQTLRVGKVIKAVA